MKLLRKYKICSHISSKTGEICYKIKKRSCLFFWVNYIYKTDNHNNYYRIYSDLEEAKKALNSLEEYR